MERGTLALLALLGAAGLAGCPGGGSNPPSLVDPNQRFVVQIVGAEIAAQKPNGDQWDTDGSAPDVQAVFECPDGERFETAVVESYTPQWASGTCEATATQLINDGFSFFLQDEDPGAADIISANIVLVPNEQELIDGQVIVRGSQALQSVTLNFLRVQ